MNILRSSSSEQPHEVSSARAIGVSLAIILAAVGGFFLAAQFTSILWQSLSYNVSSAVLSIGLVSFLYELRLRRTVEAELLRLVGIEKSLANHQLASAGQASRFDWSDVLDGASTFRVLLAEPGSWVQANWSGIIAEAKERRVSIDFFFPNPDSELLPFIARFHNLQQGELADSIRRASRIAEEEWKAAREAESLSAGSALRVPYIDAFPTYSVIRADNALVTVCFPSTSRPPAENGFALRFQGPADTYPISWYDAELKRLSVESLPQYENEVQERS